MYTRVYTDQIYSEKPLRACIFGFQKEIELK